MIYESKLTVTKELAEELQTLLNLEQINLGEMKIPEDAIFQVFTAKFDNGVEADIKVCSGQTNCYIDPVLFDDGGYEICTDSVSDELLGTYNFISEEDTYIVIIGLEA